LRRAFGEVQAVDHVTFTAPHGAVTALIGPNGSGKTTLLLILAGLLRPDAGQACVGGHGLNDGAALRSQVGWMPDVFGTWDSLSCLEVLTTFAEAYGVYGGAARSRADELLESVHLTAFARRPARVLSRGQRQRLGFARALVHDPAVVLLDEPASGLDPRSRIDLRDMLRGLARDGKTILVSSHVLVELEEVYDHAVFLSRGRTAEATERSASPAQRGWRLASLDPAALRTFLDATHIPWADAPNGDVVVALSGRDSAQELIRAIVAADVPLHTVAPVSGQLEEAYLTLDEERL
ncbi:MAG: ABC transporter ATP-binding protein, partial [Propioniciclava sp.]